MAEFPELGKRCYVSDCKQLDFLPFTCTHCGQVFCKEHRSIDGHRCACADTASGREYTGVKSYPCCFPDCSGRELMPVVCEACKKNFCLNHRHQVEHECEHYEEPKERMTQTTAHVQKIIQSTQVKKTKKPRSKKSRETAAKVALMKIKMKATGDRGTPEESRVYFQTLLPCGGEQKSRAMFFSKLWTIGRIIDKIADTAGLQNANNVGGSRKLRLFECEEGNVLPLASVLQTLMAGENTLLNGSSVILEYVEDSVTRLDNIDAYRL